MNEEKKLEQQNKLLKKILVYFLPIYTLFIFGVLIFYYIETTKTGIYTSVEGMMIFSVEIFSTLHYSILYISIIALTIVHLILERKNVKNELKTIINKIFNYILFISEIIIGWYITIVIFGDIRMSHKIHMIFISLIIGFILFYIMEKNKLKKI